MDESMRLPIILAIDDDLLSLDLIARELRKRYGEDYEIHPRQSPSEAVRDLEAWRAQGRSVALILADQWMRGLNGSELLGEARLLHPHAKRVMLVAWGDPESPETILHGCAVGQIEYFMPKPWPASPDEEFHRMIGEFLHEWARVHRPVFQAVRLVDEQWSRRGHELRDVLQRSRIAFGFYPADSDEGRRLLHEVGATEARLPVAIVFGGRVLVDPSNRELSEALGAKSSPGKAECDVAIVGAGPAGLTAAVYASSEGLDTVVLEREAIGGQAAHSTQIRNYPGFPRGISGDELAQRAYQQAWQFGTTFLLANAAESIRSSKGHHELQLSEGTLRAQSLLIANGVEYRRLGVPRIDRLVGAGVFYMAVSSEVFALGDEHVFVAGGGNSAGQAALHLSKYARRVTLVCRHPTLLTRMSSYLVTELTGTPNVDVMLESTVIDGDGDGRLRQLTIENVRSGASTTMPAGALFVLMGARPHTSWLPETVRCDAGGYLLTGGDVLTEGGAGAWSLERPPLPLETSLPGVFAAGDVRHGSARRVASAVGEGAMAIGSIHRYMGR